jgi:hypothetical protein
MRLSELFPKLALFSPQSMHIFALLTPPWPPFLLQPLHQIFLFTLFPKLACTFLQVTQRTLFPRVPVFATLSDICVCCAVRSATEFG